MTKTKMTMLTFSIAGALLAAAPASASDVAQDRLALSPAPATKVSATPAVRPACTCAQVDGAKALGG